MDVDMPPTTNRVTVASIEEIAGAVPHVLIVKLLDACQPASKGLYSRLGPIVQDTIAEGWSAGTVIMQVCSIR